MDHYELEPFLRYHKGESFHAYQCDMCGAIVHFNPPGGVDAGREFPKKPRLEDRISLEQLT